jgi:serine/threonine protein phosphatase PrpC
MVKTGLKCAGASDPGLLRHNNEDAYYFDSERGIFLVVDGIGGQAAGEKAAEIAVNRIRGRLERQTGTPEQRVREAVTMANNEIVRAARSNPEWAGMACVLTVVVLENSSAIVGHVGDSRLYKIHRGEIRKLTHDHSPVGEREDFGELSESEAMRHPRRNEVFRDVGSEEHTPDDPDFIEVLRIPFEVDSALLLCSDGLSDQVPSEDIRHLVEKNTGDPQAAVHELIDAANLAGGKDNVTVVVVEGEQFAAPVPDPVSQGVGIWRSRPVLFLCGFVLAAAAAWFSRGLWQPAPVIIAPHVLTVGPSGGYATIQEALAAARSGDTVELLGGEYREQVRLKEGVNIRSRVPREAILRAAPVGSGPAVIADDVQNARITGLRITAEKDMPLATGILLVNSPVDIEDVEISGAGVGIEIRGSASPVLRANAVHDCIGEGVLISGTAAPWLSHNSLQRNAKAGVAAHDGARPALVGNVFEKNPVDLGPDADMTAVREMNFFLETKPARGVGKK